MNWNLKIPKIMNLYWGKNKPLSYLRYLTVYSFNKYNPDWEIRIYYPKYIMNCETWITDEQKSDMCESVDFFENLLSIPNVSIYEFDMKIVGMPNDISEVHKSDIIRLYLLYKGGFWSDFDILYIKSIETSVLNTIEYKDAEALICFHDMSYYIGFLGGSINNFIFKHLLTQIPYNYNKKKYQTVGSSLYKIYKPDTYPFTKNIPKSFVYPIMWNEVNLLLEEKNFLKEDTIGIHWFGGSALTNNIMNHINDNNQQSFLKGLIKENEDRQILSLGDKSTSNIDNNGNICT
jgi:hypothetical protein